MFRDTDVLSTALSAAFDQAIFDYWDAVHARDRASMSRFASLSDAFADARIARLQVLAQRIIRCQACNRTIHVRDAKPVGEFRACADCAAMVHSVKSAGGTKWRQWFAR